MSLSRSFCIQKQELESKLLLESESGRFLRLELESRLMIPVLNGIPHVDVAKIFKSFIYSWWLWIHHLWWNRYRGQGREKKISAGVVEGGSVVFRPNSYNVAEGEMFSGLRFLPNLPQAVFFIQFFLKSGRGTALLSRIEKKMTASFNQTSVAERAVLTEASFTSSGSKCEKPWNMKKQSSVT